MAPHEVTVSCSLFPVRAARDQTNSAGLVSFDNGATWASMEINGVAVVETELPICPPVGRAEGAGATERLYGGGITALGIALDAARAEGVSRNTSASGS